AGPPEFNKFKCLLNFWILVRPAISLCFSARVSSKKISGCAAGWRSMPEQREIQISTACRHVSHVGRVSFCYNPSMSDSLTPRRMGGECFRRYLTVGLIRRMEMNFGLE
ncbi:hypothetical protein, partial [Sinorhizobium meliloti]|uniref:hypothetical protein n=1 Tax=Rhizobium meliloti TaxID=382 RepID=UPI001AEC8E74